MVAEGALAGRDREMPLFSEVAAAERTTPPPHGQVAAFRAKVRAAGQEWAGGPPDDLVELLTEAAAGDPGLAAIVRAGGRLLQDFLDGYQGKSVADVRRDLAGDLVDGDPLPPEVTAGLAARYLVVVVKFAKAGPGVEDLRAVGGQGTLMTYREENLVLLIPVSCANGVEHIVTRLARCLGGCAWFATAERDRTHVAEGFDEASRVLRLAVAGRRPVGGYAISDVLVEFAVMSNEKVRSDLAAVIRPLRVYEVLWQTLTAFIDADYSRNKAARSLFVHRSTLDYRLRRIGAVTGCDPTTGRGAHLLTAAMIAEVTGTPGHNLSDDQHLSDVTR